jgi:hypothetical protein
MVTSAWHDKVSQVQEQCVGKITSEAKPGKKICITTYVL